MRKTLKALIVGLAATGLLLSSCGKKDDPVNPDPGPVVVVTLNSISVNNPKTSFFVGEAFALGGTVSARYSDNSVKDVTASATVTAPDMSTAGNKSVTVSYTEGGVTKQYSYQISVSNPSLSSLSAADYKVGFHFGDEFELGPIKVTAHYNNGADKLLSSSEYSYVAPDMSTAGTKAVTLSYTDGDITKEFTYSINVVAVLSSISSANQSVDYKVGDQFSYDGDLTAHYNDGSSKVISEGYSVSAPDMSSRGEKDITVSYEEDGVSKSTSYTINVVAVLSSISASGYTTNYHLGDTYSFDGTVTAHYNDNLDAAVTSYSVSSPDMSTTGDKTVTITYSEGGVIKTCDISIKVNADLVSIEASDFTSNWNVGDEFVFDGKVTATYSDTQTAEVNNYSVSTPDMSSRGNKDVTITYSEGGIERTYVITISVNALLDNISVAGYTVNWHVGESYNFDGVVTAHYNDGVENVIDSGYVVDNPDMSDEGLKDVVISYEEGGISKSVTVQISVTYLALTSLSVSGMKTSFFVGDEFSFDGVATATYEDSSSKAVTPTEITEPDMSSAGAQTIVVSYTEHGITKSDSYEINVVAIAISELQLSGMTTEFFTEDQFSFDGSIKAVYNNGNEVVVDASDVTIDEPDMDTAGVQSVTVSYTDPNGLEASASYNVTITQLAITSLELYYQSENYFVGDEFEFDGLAVAFYNNGDYDVLDLSDLDVTEPDMSVQGDKLITVSYDGGTYGSASASYSIHVEAVVLTNIEALYMTQTYYVGDAFSFDGSLFALYNNGKGRVVTPTSVSTPDMSVAGVKGVNITYEEDGISKSVSYSINVMEAPDTSKSYTYNDYLSISPSNWNELTYQDNNDTNILSPISGGLFTFDYKYDEAFKPIPGAYTVQYDGATGLEDVTALYAGDPNYSVPEGAESGFAYKITLRNDLRWDNGDPINADTFVYTMQEQLNPLFLNYRADSFYGGSGTVIHNAERYLKQGQSGIFSSKGVYNGVYDESEDNDLIWSSYFDPESNDESSYLYSWFRSNNGSDYDSYFAKGEYGMFAIPMLWGVGYSFNPKEMAAAMDGKTLAEIKADPAMNAAWEEILGWWQTDPGEELDFFVTNYTFPAMTFDKVGFFKGDNDYEIILVLDKTLNLLNEDGTLSYKAAYNMASLPLVKPDLYESCKVAPATEGGLWTSTYNTSVATSASWGPYKLTSFQAGKQFILERNDQWYGYSMNQYKGQYQTTKIVTDIIDEWNTAWLAFQQGDIAQIGIDVSIADDYKASSRGRFTPSDFISSLQLQSSKESLHKRETEGTDKDILGYTEFREALSLCLDRADYAAKVTTASKAGLGLFNSMHYIAVDEGLVYRETDEAKLAICEAYGIDPQDYENLDEAYAACTGYNLSLARTRLEEAYAACKEDGLISDTDVVTLVVGTSTITESVTRQFEYLQAAFSKLAETTVLEGRITLVLDDSFGSKWATDFMDGAYDICTGAWTGAAWDPCYLISAYIDPNTAYSASWDTSKVPMTYNPWQDDDPEHNLTMSLMDWYECLNGLSDTYPYDWSEGNVETSFRVGILAQLEKAVLKAYYSVPIVNAYSAALISYKLVANFDYNTFMGYGGTRYLKYAYDDAAWELVKDTFDYRD